jgi:hypothetical protein
MVYVMSEGPLLVRVSSRACVATSVRSSSSGGLIDTSVNAAAMACMHKEKACFVNVPGEWQFLCRSFKLCCVWQTKRAAKLVWGCKQA